MNCLIVAATGVASGQTLNPEAVINQFQSLGTHPAHVACRDDPKFPWIKRTDRMCYGTSDLVIRQFLGELDSITIQLYRCPNLKRNFQSITVANGVQFGCLV